MSRDAVRWFQEKADAKGAPMRTPHVLLLSLLAAWGPAGAQTAVQGLLPNASFEQADPGDATQAAGWRRFAHDGGYYTVERFAGDAADGRHCLEVVGRAPGGRAGASGTSQRIEQPAPGYRLDFAFKGVAAAPDLLLRFRDAQIGRAHV